VGNEAQPSCFVIGPIGDELAPAGNEKRKTWEDAIEIWETVIAPACASVGLDPLRADQITDSGEITEQTFLHLRDDDVVIADLTQANPNVMYELGLRHTKHKLTIQIGEAGRLPFDVTVIRTTRFVRTPHTLNQARDRLVEALRTGLAGGFQPVTATRIWNELPGGPTGEPGLAVAPESPTDEPGYMEKIAEMEVALPMLSVTLDQWSQVFVEMNAVVVKATEDVTASDARGGGMAGRLLVANRLAASLTMLCDRLDAIVQTYSEQMQSTDVGFSALIDIIENDPKQLQDALPLVEQVSKVSAIFQESAKTAVTTIEMTRGMGKASRQLKAVSGRIEHAIRAYLEIADSVHRWAIRLEKLREATEQPVAASVPAPVPVSSRDRPARSRTGPRTRTRST
jgi:hypothetical protein